MPVLTRDNIKEAIEDIGGVVKIADMFDIGRNAVSNWYKRGFPPETRSVLAPRLRRKGWDFTEDIFNQYRIKRATKKQRDKNVVRRGKRGGEA